MMMTDYMINVLCRLSCLVSGTAMLTAAVALFCALLESVTSKPSKAKLGFALLLHSFAWSYPLSCRIRKLFAALSRGEKYEKCRI